MTTTLTTATPGPWRAVPDRGCVLIVGPKDEQIAMVNRAYGDEDDADREVLLPMEANARLAATAPELLRLAYQYRNDAQFGLSADSAERRLDMITSVIKKAEGQA